jgi:hypothetical protein
MPFRPSELQARILSALGTLQRDGADIVSRSPGSDRLVFAAGVPRGFLQAWIAEPFCRGKKLTDLDEFDAALRDLALRDLIAPCQTDPRTYLQFHRRFRRPDNRIVYFRVTPDDGSPWVTAILGTPRTPAEQAELDAEVRDAQLAAEAAGFHGEALQDDHGLTDCRSFISAGPQVYMAHQITSDGVALLDDLAPRQAQGRKPGKAQRTAKRAKREPKLTPRETAAWTAYQNIPKYEHVASVIGGTRQNATKLVKSAQEKLKLIEARSRSVRTTQRLPAGARGEAAVESRVAGDGDE